eukprot:1159657-Pelagomonas_calceolata.AAC.3
MEGQVSVHTVLSGGRPRHSHESYTVGGQDTAMCRTAQGGVRPRWWEAKYQCTQCSAVGGQDTAMSHTVQGGGRPSISAHGVERWEAKTQPCVAQRRVRRLVGGQQTATSYTVGSGGGRASEVQHAVQTWGYCTPVQKSQASAHHQCNALCAPGSKGTPGMKPSPLPGCPGGPLQTHNSDLIGKSEPRGLTQRTKCAHAKCTG